MDKQSVKIEFFVNPMFGKVASDSWKRTAFLQVDPHLTNREIISYGLGQIGTYPKSYGATVYVSTQKMMSPFATIHTWEERVDTHQEEKLYSISHEELEKLQELYNLFIISSDPDLIELGEETFSFVLNRIQKREGLNK